MKIFKRNKKANILTENIIFIVLNLVFLGILMLFLFSKTGSAAVLEEKYAKEIALAIDSARPGMVITLEMPDAFKKAEKNGIALSEAVKVNGNVVTVKLQDNGDYSYSFFNDVELNPVSLNSERTGVILDFPPE